MGKGLIFLSFVSLELDLGCTSEMTEEEDKGALIGGGNIFNCGCVVIMKVLLPSLWSAVGLFGV